MKKALQYKIGAYITLSTILVSVFLAQSVYAGTLSCNITTAALCTGGTNTIILRMSGTTETNAHAELATGSNYTSKVVCCSGVAGLGNSCSGTNATVLRLSGATNAHVEQNSLANYSNLACMSVSAGTVSVGYSIGTDCITAGYDTAIASMSALTNAHMGTSTAYTYKVCATAAAGVANKGTSGSVTSSVFDTLVTGGAFNSIFWKGNLGGAGLNEGKVRFQFAASNCTNGATDFPTCVVSPTWNYIGGATCSTGDWFDPGAANTPIELKGLTCQSTWNNKRYFKYKIQICSNDCVTGGVNTPTVSGVVVNWAP